MTTSTVDTVSAVAREACLSALATHTARPDADPGRRIELLAAAWWAGVRDLVVLGAAAGCTVDEVRAGLRVVGVDPVGASVLGSPRPAYAPLRAGQVREVAEVVGRIVGPASLRTDPSPEALLAWHLHIALLRLAVVLDDAAPVERRAEMAHDLVERLRTVLALAEEVMAGLHGREELAALAERDDEAAVAVEGQAVAEGATVTLGLPVGHSITVTVSRQPYGRPGAGYTTVTSSSTLLDTLSRVDGAEHLQLRHALDTIARVFTGRLAADAREPG
ncbi:hypothetical protein [Kitasatospora sp. NPDC094016]|uniref:hypothetical protein n=1 Tax=Kitasatospora sp. NPDC094016 TaxID=3154986 RepID=UPI003326E5CA